MLNERRRAVLSALVEEYIRSAQPVASKALVERYDLGCSPATVRNDLAALEETGYVYQPHVSAGRIPTDLGYRIFVDDLAQRGGGGLTVSEVDAIRRYYDALEREIDDVMRETSGLLSRLTHNVSLVVAPTIRRARIRRVNVVPMGGGRALVVVVTDSGRVADRHADMRTPLSASDAAAVETFLNERLENHRAEDARTLRDELAKRDGMQVPVLVLDEIIDCLDEADDARLYHGGVAALLAQPEFADAGRVTPLVALLEDGLEVLRMVSELVHAEGTTVRIGRENALTQLGGMSLVASPYGSGGDEGMVGLIGPVRMDYSRAITAVRCVAESLSAALSA